MILLTPILGLLNVHREIPITRQRNELDAENENESPARPNGELVKQYSPRLKKTPERREHLSNISS